MADDFVEVSVTPEQAKALQAEMGTQQAPPAVPASPTATASPVQDYLPPETTTAKPNFFQGAGNLLGAVGHGVNQGLINLGDTIQNPMPLLNQVEQAGRVEAQHNNPLWNAVVPGGEQTLGAGAGALQGTAQLANGVLGLPAAISNAWNGVEPGKGQNADVPAIQIPTGDLDRYIQENHPVSGFAGSFVPFIGIEALTGGAATPELMAQRGGNILGRIGKSAAVGAGYGIVGTPGELKERGEAALTNATLGAGLGAIGEGLHAITGGAETPIGLKELNRETPTESEMIRDPQTGLLRPAQKPIETSSANAPDAQAQGTKILTGHISNVEPETTSGNVAPWDREDIENAKDHFNNDDDNGGGGDPAQQNLNPITGQPEPSQDITAQIEAIRQRQAQETAAREQQKQALLQRIQQQGQQMEGNQAAASPSPENVQAAQSAVEQLRARQQALLQQQQEQAVQQKADELHTLLSNYEKAGLKSNANKLKAQIAENAVKHPDPIEKAASQRALEKYAPSQKYPEGTTHTDAKGNPVKLVEQDSPEQGMSIVQDQNGSYYWTKNEELSPVEGYTPKPSAKSVPNPPKAEPVKVSVKQPEAKPEQPLEAQVTKTGESANEPQGQIQQPEGQQPTQGAKEVQPGSEQEPSTGEQGQETLTGRVEASREPQTENIKPPHTEVNAVKTDEMVKGGLNFPKLVGIETPDGSVQLITGSHRYAALEKAGEPIQGHVYMMQPEDLKNGDWKSLQQEAASTKDFNGLVDKVHENTDNPELKALLEDQAGRTDRSKTGKLIQGGTKKTLEPESKKKTVDDGLDAIYPEKPYPKEPIFDKSKPQGTNQREHLLEAQAHKEGKYQLPHEIETDPAFREAYAQLDSEGQEKLHTIVDAIINKKKLSTGFYNPGTETNVGVLTKRAAHGQELYSPKGLSVTKKGDILVHGYNENAELSSRRLDRFSGEVKKTTETGYEGLYKHPSDLNESETFHPADAIVEQVANPILKKQIMGKAIVESDYRQAGKTLETLLEESETTDCNDILSILKRLPDKVKEYMKDYPCK